MAKPKPRKYPPWSRVFFGSWWTFGLWLLVITAAAYVLIPPLRPRIDSGVLGLAWLVGLAILLGAVFHIAFGRRR